jgi:hypothetical protein
MLLEGRNKRTEYFVTCVHGQVAIRLGIYEEIMTWLFRNLIVCSVDVK